MLHVEGPQQVSLQWPPYKQNPYDLKGTHAITSVEQIEQGRMITSYLDKKSATNLPFLILAVWVIFSAAMLHVEGASASESETGPSSVNAPPLSLEGLFKSAQLLDGHDVKIRGYLTIEPENRNLWDSAESFASNTGRSAKVWLTDEWFNHLEAFNRREIVVHAQVRLEKRSSACVDPSCYIIELTNPRFVGYGKPINESSVFPIPVEMLNYYKTDADAPDQASLALLAEDVEAAIRAGESNK